MDFITSSILGGILYDISKDNLINFNEKLKNSLKGYIFSEKEVSLLNELSNNISQKKNYTKEDYTKAIDSNQNIQHLIRNLAKKKVIINNIQTNNGIVMEDNHGTINFGK